MKKVFLVITALVLITFFYPKERIFSCGAVCTNEGFTRVQQEKQNTTCLGFETMMTNIIDADGKICYGIFIKNKK